MCKGCVVLLLLLINCVIYSSGEVLHPWPLFCSLCRDVACMHLLVAQWHVISEVLIQSDQKPSKMQVSELQVTFFTLMAEE